MSDRIKILIAGAGIGGLTTAITLRRAGFDVEVFERAPELREVGAAISLWANATRVMQRLGLLDELLKYGAVIKTGAIRRHDGAMIHEAVVINTDVPGICLHRADLQATLLRALPPGCLRLGEALMDFVQDSESITARFAGGHEARGDILVGADGLHSVVRAKVLADGPPVYCGYQCWRGVNPKAKEEQISESLGPGARFGIVPMGTRGTAWWACANEPETATGAPENSREKLLRLFREWHEPIGELIAGTAEAGIIRNAIFDRLPKRPWSRGRAVLLGDAAHPTTPNLGQGGCMAIEDAVVLTRCLERQGASHEALQQFEDLRFRRTNKIVRDSLNWGRMAQLENPLARAGRDILLRHLPRSVMIKNLLEVMNYDAFAVAV